MAKAEAGRMGLLDNPDPQSYIRPMNVKSRQIEVDAETAALLEARAAPPGMTVADLLADLAGAEALPAPLAGMRAAGRGPWADDVLAEDARRLAAFRRTRESIPFAEVQAWMASWGRPDELPLPRPRKL
ncbi:MAG: hypothetical protein WD036_11830 [Bauldia sp.]